MQHPDETQAAEVMRLKAENIELARLLGAFVGYHDGRVTSRHIGHVALPQAKALLADMIERNRF